MEKKHLTTSPGTEGKRIYQLPSSSVSVPEISYVCWAWHVWSLEGDESLQIRIMWYQPVGSKNSTGGLFKDPSLQRNSNHVLLLFLSFPHSYTRLLCLKKIASILPTAIFTNINKGSSYDTINSIPHNNQPLISIPFKAKAKLPIKKVQSCRFMGADLNLWAGMLSGQRREEDTEQKVAFKGRWRQKHTKIPFWEAGISPQGRAGSQHTPTAQAPTGEGQHPPWGSEQGALPTAPVSAELINIGSLDSPVGGVLGLRPAPSILSVASFNTALGLVNLASSRWKVNFKHWPAS